MFILVGDSLLPLVDKQIECLQKSFTEQELINYLNASFTQINCFKQARIDIPRMKIIVNGKNVRNIKGLLRYKKNAHFKLLIQCCTQALISYPYNFLCYSLSNHSIVECAPQKGAVIVIKVSKKSFKVDLIKRMRVVEPQGNTVKLVDGDPVEFMRVKIIMRFDSETGGVIECRRIG